MSFPKPFLKWVGGKGKVLDTLMPDFPSEINNYHEIFLGGGSVLFALLSQVKNGKIKLGGKVFAYDINESLIYTYKNIQTNNEELYKAIKVLINEFSSSESGEDYYYSIREKFNNLAADDKRGIDASAMFIFLNKTCFRGLFRVGPSGFNVPYGNYKKPEIFNEYHLEMIRDLIRDVVFEHMDFSQSLVRLNVGDFAYLDPPYYPEKKTSFVKYSENGFNDEHHNMLFSIIHRLSSDTKIKLMMSNSNVKFVRDNFPNSRYSIKTINCRRAINSKDPGAMTSEIIIKNYD